MNRITLLLTAVAALPLAGFASTPLATVSSAEPVTLAGHSISAPGVSSWPLVTGDEIATSTAPATILFRDGSSVALAAKSSARLTGTSVQPKLVLMAGTLNYKIVPGSKLVLSKSAADNSVADSDSGSGSDAGSIAPASKAPAAAAHGISHGAMIAGILAAAGVVMVIPTAILTQSAPASLPNLSAR
jgi:hypothetical protein